MSLLVLLLAAVCGLTAAIAVGNLLSYFAPQREPTALPFAAVATSFVGYLALQLAVFSSHDLERTAQLLRCQGFLLASSFLFLAWFLAAFAGRSVDWVDRLIVGGYLLIAVWSLASPCGYWFSSLKPSTPFPSGDLMLYQPRGTPSPVYAISALLQLPLFGRGIWDGIQMMRRGRRVEGLWWSLATGLLFVASVHDKLVDWESLPGPYWGELAFPLLVLGMGVRLSTRRWAATRELFTLQRSLQASEATFRDIFDNASEALFMQCPTTGRFLDANRTATEMYGWTRDEFLTLTVEDLSVPAAGYTNEEATRALAKTAGGRPNVFSWLARRSNGTSFPVEVALRRTIIGGEERVMASIRDVTERIRTDERVRIHQLERLAALEARDASETRYRTLFDSAGDGILIEQGGRLVDANAAAVAMFGFSSREEFLQCESSRLSPEWQPGGLSSAQATQERMEAAKDGEPQRFRWLHQKRQGAEFLADVSLTAFHVGSDVYLQAILRDVTERVQLEERLHSAQRLESIGELAGGVAHDFNNLLVPVVGYSSLLLEELPPDAPIREELTAIHRAGEKAQSLVRRLLNFGRRTIMTVTTLDVTEHLTSLTPLLGSLLGETILLELTPTAGLPAVEADPTQLEQVVVNLTVNARDAMKNGGKLTIGTRLAVIGPTESTRLPSCTPGTYVCLFVSDTGTGMSPAVLSRIFEPFFTTKPPGTGTGLGLAAVLGIVQQHGGTMGVESVEGVGSTFSVYLPTSRAVAQPLATPETEPPVRGGGESIFLVEDEPAVRSFVVAALERNGYEVIVADSPQRALALAASMDVPPSLLLTDVVMPELDGRALHSKLAERWPDLAVLYMSGYSGDHVSTHGILADGIELLHKPFTIHELTVRVRQKLLRTSHAPSPRDDVTAVTDAK